MKFKNVTDVVSWRLCVGCGACAAVCPEKKITLVDFIDHGIRPVVSSNDCGTCMDCLKVCPGIGNSHIFDHGDHGMKNLRYKWGPIIEIWEGYATDPDLRYCGSSGGVASALALYGVEKEGMQGVLHVGYESENPWVNKTVFSNSRDDLLSRTGSRYSPASPCDGLDLVESSEGACIFIGKPCDINALRNIQSLRPELKDKIGAAIGIFCAGTPSTRGTLQLLENIDVNPTEIKEIKYRGKGWPGAFTIESNNNDGTLCKLSYMDSWGFLQKYRPYRCYLCPDGTSERADISCGDPWYREIKENEHGYSLVLVRTETGRKIVDGAMKAGYVTLEKAAPSIMDASQKNLLSKRGEIWGRLFTMKLLGIPTPQYRGIPLFKNWLRLSVARKIRSIVGTARRIIQRKYYVALKLG